MVHEQAIGWIVQAGLVVRHIIKVLDGADKGGDF